LVVRIDGRDVFFGSSDGTWGPQAALLPPHPGGKRRLGHKSVWVCERISITQTVEIVPSSTGALDTCLVRYLLENKDGRPHAVGVRALVDTMIDDNDGHPFAEPDGKLITTSADFRGNEVPSHVKALQCPDLAAPGLVAVFTLKVGGKLESPNRFVITTWPGGKCGWSVPVGPIGGDAAVAIYWNPAALKAGQQRGVGYAYGLGVASLEKAPK
jgi:hypothetical protein